MANIAGVEPSKPRICGKMGNRNNAAGADVGIQEYFHLNIYIPFLDHIIMELETQFDRKYFTYLTDTAVIILLFVYVRINYI